MLKHDTRQFAGDETTDYLNDLGNVNWRDKLITDITWSVDKWTTTLQVSRYGRVPNAAQDGYITPSSLANISTQYHINSNSSVSLIVQNMLDEIKYDNSFGWPFYPVGNYLPYGRQGWVQFGYRL